MPHAFISYVREDSAKVDQIARALRGAGLAVWLDRDELAAGMRWQVAIRQAIEDGLLFIACFSRAALTRAALLHERGASHRNR